MVPFVSEEPVGLMRISVWVSPPDRVAVCMTALEPPLAVPFTMQ